jgi:DNA-binding transcriptional MerR regulator
LVSTLPMSLREANAPAGPEIPGKLYFRIGEVSRLVGVQPHVLRYWETEFPALAPKKAGTGHRLYRRKDVELLLEIKNLLYEKRYTIEGARRHLEGRSKAARREASAHSGRQAALFEVQPGAWETLRKELASLLELLK